jgi:hypothetical protein
MQPINRRTGRPSPHPKKRSQQDRIYLARKLERVGSGKLVRSPASLEIRLGKERLVKLRDLKYNKQAIEQLLDWYQNHRHLLKHLIDKVGGHSPKAFYQALGPDKFKEIAKVAGGITTLQYNLILKKAAQGKSVEELIKAINGWK